MSTLLQFWDILRHLDQHLADWSQSMGGWLYWALFAVIFAETGLVVTPFLPGDSLMFAVGALCAVIALRQLGTLASQRHETEEVCAENSRDNRTQHTHTAYSFVPDETQHTRDGAGVL